MDELEKLHEDFDVYIVEKRFDLAEIFVKEKISFKTDINILRTVMVIIKGLRSRIEFELLHDQIVAVLEIKTGKIIL